MTASEHAAASRTASETVHASCVALAGRAVLVLGPSGSGKSALALQLMALGCVLVSDDRTVLTLRRGHLCAAAPPAIRGRIEARGVGILSAAAVAARVAVAVDLTRAETERLPKVRSVTFLGTDIPLVRRVDSDHFPAAILQYLKGGRSA